eukprot:7681606-Alexandrium_andersonii.AAC.1
MEPRWLEPVREGGVGIGLSRIQSTMGRSPDLDRKSLVCSAAGRLAPPPPSPAIMSGSSLPVEGDRRQPIGRARLPA